MSKKIKISLFIILAAIASIGVAFYIVSTKIDPKLIKEKAVEAIEENLRDVKASIGDVSYDLGFTVRLNLKELQIASRTTGERLLSVQNARVELPIFAILTNGGTVDIKVESPELIYKELEGGDSNWKRALPEARDQISKEGSKKEESEQEKKGEVELPSFVENSRVDLSVTKLNLQHVPLDAKPTNIMLNKILLKNLNLKKTTAFEVISNANYGVDQNKTISGKFQLVGEVSLNNLLKTGALDTNMLLNIEDIKLSWLDMNIPAFKNVIKFRMKDNGKIEANLRTSAGSALNLEADVKIDEKFEQVVVSRWQSSLSLPSLPGILGPQMGKGLSNIDFNKSRFLAEGTAALDLKNNKAKPDLSFSLDRPVNVSVAGQPVAVSFKGGYKGENVSLNVKNELMSGVATLDASTVINPLMLPEKIENYAPINAQLLITNLKLEKPFIQKLIYGGEAKKSGQAGESSQGQASGTQSPAEPIAFPPFNLTMEGKHITINRKELNMAGKVSGKSNLVNIPSIKLDYGAGIANINAKANLKTTENIASSFNISLTGMEMEGLNAFLPPLISEIKGRYDGTVSGQIKKEKELAYDVKTVLKATDGELKNLNLSSFLMPLIDSVSFLKGKVDEEKLQISDKFEALALNARATETVVSLNTFNFVGNNKSVILDAEGKISMKETGNSKVTAELVISEIAEQIKQYSGASDLPILLEGKGFGMLPNAKYTTDKLTGRVAKIELNKQKKKLDTQIKKEKKKLEKELEKKAKDLLKGFKL